MIAALKKIVDAAAHEQDKAELADLHADRMTAGQRARVLADRDRAVARASAFLEAARMVQEGMSQ